MERSKEIDGYSKKVRKTLMTYVTNFTLEKLYSSAASKISSNSSRMWICGKCSYAYNPQWVKQCDICESNRTTQLVSKDNSSKSCSLALIKIDTQFFLLIYRHRW